MKFVIAMMQHETNTFSALPTPYEAFNKLIVEARAELDEDKRREMYRGAEAALGPMALLRVVDPDSDVRVIVGGERFQCLDQAVFRHLGVEPSAQKILVVKSTVHFRADFEPIAEQVLVVEAPGAHPCRLDGLDYRRLRPGVRLGPGGPIFAPQDRRAAP